MSGNIPNKTQEQRVLDALLAAKGSYVNGQYFLRTLFLSQYHRAIFNLENREDWKAKLNELGVKIEHSTFTDEFGFRSYRLVKTSTPVKINNEVVNVSSMF